MGPLTARKLRKGDKSCFIVIRVPYLLKKKDPMLTEAPLLFIAKTLNMC